MKAIIIAAGPATRLRPITLNVPKCMLKINGKPILQHMIDTFKQNGIHDISIIRGYQKDKIDFDNIAYFENRDFMNNNILHSLMNANAKMEEAIKDREDLIISYSDILYERAIVEKLIACKEPISAVVDTDWHAYYQNRTDHPIGEAENVIFDDTQHIVKIGKHIFTDSTPKDKQGEFIGLWKFTPIGTQNFVQHFNRLDLALRMTDPYQNAKEWQKSYITDIFQEMTDHGEKIHCTLIKQGWKEFDTVQDFERAGGELPE